MDQRPRRSRIGPQVTLVASLALVVVCLGAWLSADRGVGMQLPRSVPAAEAPESTAGAPATNPAAEAGTDLASPAEADEPPVPNKAETQAGPTIARVDATGIPVAEVVAAPTGLAIPTVDLSMPIVATGVLPDGQMELPANPDRIGWYQFGPEPGADRGSAVLGGHVDSVKHGTGPLARLAALDIGARIEVTDAAGERLAYRVTSVQRISKAALPTDTLFDPVVRPRLVVVTCGGRYLPDAGGYEDNVVVIAKPV